MSSMKRTKKLLLYVLLFAMSIFTVPVCVSKAADASQTEADTAQVEIDYDKQYVVMSLEGLTLGQGYYIQPQKMSYSDIAKVWENEGVDIDLSQLTLSQATYAFFKEAGFETEPALGSAYNSSSFYLKNVLAVDNGETNIPQVITDGYKKIHNETLTVEANDDKNLGEFDYTSMSGWMNTVDNVFPDTGAGQYILAVSAGESTTHVVRWQYTLADYGGDLGYSVYGYDDAHYYESADKSALYTAFAENIQLLNEHETAKNSILAVMEKLDATDTEISGALNTIEDLKDSRAQVTLKMSSLTPVITITDSVGNVIETGTSDNYTYSLKLEPGLYTLTGYAADGVTAQGSVELNVSTDKVQSYELFTVYNITCSNSGWVENTDYTMAVAVTANDGTDRKAVCGKYAATDSDSKKSVICFSGDTVTATVTPIGEQADGYVEKTVSATITANRSYGFSMSAPVAVNMTISVPEGATLRVGTLTTYFIYQDIEAVKTASVEAGYDTYTVKAGKGTTYYYRVSVEGGVTYWNWVSPSTDTTYKVTPEDMYIDDASVNSDTVINDFTSNIYDVADIYMTGNAQGYISLKTGDTYTLDCYRSWQAIEGISNAKTAEPDFHYTVIDENGRRSSDVIKVTTATNTATAHIEAVGQGTAIVLVTYDAMTNVPGMGGKLYSAIWPENTGVLIVSVDEDGSSIATNMCVNSNVSSLNTLYGTVGSRAAGDKLDAELDVLYYIAGTEGATYEFTPEAGVTVQVLRPSYEDNALTYEGFTSSGVSKNSDGSYTITGLTKGSNIIKVTKNGLSTYQVIRAKEVDVDIKYTDADGNDISASELSAGDKIQLTFGKINANGKSYEGLYIPANKFAGVYNMSGSIAYVDNEGNLYKGTANQYLFGSTAASQTITITIPKYYNKSSFRISGALYETGYGSSYGSHREVTHQKGKPANFTAVITTAYMGSLPDMEFALAKAEFANVKLKVTDETTGTAVKDYTINVTDSSGNVSDVTDAAFSAKAGETYTYEVYASGYMYKSGTIAVPQDSEEMTSSIRLTPAGDNAWDGITETEPEQDSDGTYIIKTGAELYWFSNKVKSSTSANKTTDINGKLAADIDLAGYKWTPIGASTSNVYEGCFDGAGYTIKNLYIEDVSYAGLFGVTKGQITGINVTGKIVSSKNNLGAIAGYIQTGTTSRNAMISDCVSYVDITSTAASGSNVGGIAGYTFASTAIQTTIKNCINYGKIEASGCREVGGITGYTSASNVVVENCTNYGDINANYDAGGIFGYIKYSTKAVSQINNCYNAGSITANKNAGGIAGLLSGSTTEAYKINVTNCYNAGIVTSGTDNGTAPLCGSITNTNVSGCYYSSTDSKLESIDDSIAVYVSASDIETVKEITDLTLSKSKHGELLDSLEEFVNYFSNLNLSEEDKAFVTRYNELYEAVYKLKTVNVGVYDYAATAAGIDGASKTGVILDSSTTVVEAADAVSAIEKALTENNIAYEAYTSYGSTYFSSINNLEPQADYYWSGWSFAYNHDDYDNLGASYITIADGDVLEFHYGLTGGDIASVYSGLPAFKTMSIGGYELNFTIDTKYDENGNSIFTYKANDEVLEGDGSKESPFVVEVHGFTDTDKTKVAVAYETEALDNYVTVEGLDSYIDMSQDVSCSIASAGRKTYYILRFANDLSKEITDDNTKVTIADTVYTGEAVTPDVQVKVAGILLGEDDYTVEFTDNVNAGTAFCTVTGEGEFTGSVKTSFVIGKANQEVSCDITDIEAYDDSEEAETGYDIHAVSQTELTYTSQDDNVVSVDDKGHVTVNGIGQTTITVSAAESDNYMAGEIVIHVTIKGDMKKATVADIENQVYTGEKLTPAVAVTYKGNLLTENTDYTLSYKKNTVVGTALVIITGCGNYSGSIETEFNIVCAPQSIQTAQEKYEVFEDAESFAITAAGKGTITYESSNPNVAEIDADGVVTVKTAGFTDIIIKAAGTSNYESAELTVRVTVKKKTEDDSEPTTSTTEDSSNNTETTTGDDKNSAVTEAPEKPAATTEESGNTDTVKREYVMTKDNTVIKVQNQTYTGRKLTPEVIVIVNGIYVDSANYNLVYKNNKNVGTATVSITGKGKYSGTITGSFTISKASQQIINVLSTYKKKYSSSSFKLNAKAKTAVTYVSSNKKVAVVNKTTGRVQIKGCGKAVITITAKGKNYKTVTKKVTIIVAPDKTSITKLKSTSKAKINITYKKKTGATGYEVVYSTSKTFKTAKTKTKLVKGKSKNKAVIKGLTPGKKYYVKVRAYKTIDGKRYYSSYSKVKTVVVKR